MRIRVSGTDLSKLQADLAACFAYEGDRQPRGVEHAGLRRALARRMRAERFEARAGDQLIWHTDEKFGASRFLVVGLGPRGGKPVGEALRTAAAIVAQAGMQVAAGKLALRLPGSRGPAAASELRAAAEGICLGAYRFDRHRTDPSRRKTAPKSVELSAEGSVAPLRKAARQGQVGADAVCLARDLVNEAPSRMTPSAMATEARRQSRSAGLRCKVLGRTELQRLGLQALLSVSRGSAEPPKVVQIVYKPAKARGRLVLVGKGVTFDSGGLDLKPAEYMLTMKSDMAGAAAVLATMTALADVGCRAEVHGFLGLVENMTGGAAYKPGDVLDTYAGKTVEVGNTDAEGRLVLCDVLAYAAKKLKPDGIVDVATLTGAAVVALGTRATALFARDDGLRDALLRAGESAGEKIWPMPLYEDYLKLMQKGPADLCNVAGRWGGAITAALFLGEFVPRDVPWAHLDIAGPAFNETELPEAPLGGTGAGVLSLLRWLETR